MNSIKINNIKHIFLIKIRKGRIKDQTIASLDSVKYNIIKLIKHR